jgi:hypothetical protein
MKTCITFGGGAPNFKEACVRLVGQAESMGVFDQVHMYTEADLKAVPDFWAKHSNFIENNSRLYGYAIWKPYLIQKLMKDMNDGDIILYLDCGCELDVRKKDKMIEFFEVAKNDSIIMSPNCLEFDWTKMDLVLKLGMLDNKYLYTSQHETGAIMFCVNDKTRKLVDEWYELGCDYHLIDDSPSFSQNLSGFQEHRHDQSTFSLLTKKYNLYSRRDIKEAVYYIRNRSGISKLEPLLIISN